MKKIIILACSILMPFFSFGQEYSITEIESNMNNLKAFVTTSPLDKEYYIPRLATPDSSLSVFLYYCIKNAKCEVQPYAFVAALKVLEELIILDLSDYDYCNYDSNPLLEIIIKKMEFDYNDVNCEFLTSYTIFMWLKRNKSFVKSDSLLFNQFKKVKKMM